MVWLGISWDGQTDLVVLNRGKLTGQRYIDDILDQARPYAGAVGDQFIPLDDNARPPIVRMDWPARSPPFIEQLWNELQVRVSARQLQLRTIQALGAMMVKERAAIPVITIRNLIGNMRRRCQAVIDSLKL
jgi:hypothetical protein